MRLLRTFQRDERGATAVIFGLALLPLLAAAGAAVDYSRAANVRTSLQKAVDAAALSVARDADALKRRDLQERGRDFFAANFVTPADATIESVSVSREGKGVRVAAEGSVDNAIMPVFGFERTAISAEAVVGWGTRKVELALVLDNTGSMNTYDFGKRRLDELKRAVRTFLANHRQELADEDLKVSIVPFDTQVNVRGLLKRDWVDFRAVDERRWSRHEGCVVDRAQTGDFDISDAAPNGGARFPAAECNESGRSRLGRLQPLTSSFDELDGAVKAMEPVGCTNITIGATWGLKTLSASEPFEQGSPAGAERVERHMVVLTDGFNTQNAVIKTSECDGSRGNGEVAAIDTRTLAACRAATGQGIAVYTVLVGRGNEQLLQQCAGAQGRFIPVADARGIEQALGSLLGDILAPRLTQ